jgi:release factor glutamine methyltransferase
MCLAKEPAAQTLGSLLAEVAGGLAAAGFDEPRRRARRLAGAALDLDPAELLAHPQRAVAAPQERRLRWMLRRLIGGEPISRIAGRRAFWGLEFGLSADTLDPRPDSEAVVAAVLARIPKLEARLRLLDLGTGTGCLLLALLSELPRASGVGVDIAAGAAATARLNAAALGLDRRARFFVGEWGRALDGRFAVIVANPPYIPSPTLADLPGAVRSYDPRRALDGGPDGLDAYRAIAADLPRLLRQDGIFAAEIGVGQGDAISALLSESGLAPEAIERDLAGIARCLVARPLPHRFAGAAGAAKNGWNVPSSRLG